MAFLRQPLRLRWWFRSGRVEDKFFQDAAVPLGRGANAVRWISVDAQQQMDVFALEEQILADRAAGLLPFLVVGTAGTTSTGAVDPLPEIAAICRKYDL